MYVSFKVDVSENLKSIHWISRHLIQDLLKIPGICSFPKTTEVCKLKTKFILSFEFWKVDCIQLEESKTTTGAGLSYSNDWVSQILFNTENIFQIPGLLRISAYVMLREPY